MHGFLLPDNSLLMNSCRLLFVGFDSAEPTLLHQWADDGILPVFARLRAGSSWGSVELPRGLSNAAAWASLYTGVNPGRHGWCYGTCMRPGSYAQRPFNPDRDLRARPLWESANRVRRRVAVIDVPKAPFCDGLATENGSLQLSDWLAHGTNPSARGRPAELARQALERYGADPMGETSDDGFRGARGLKRLRDRALERIRAKTALSLDLLARANADNPWDLFMTCFSDAHDIGHRCWHLHDTRHPRHDAAWRRRWGDPLRDLYIALDRALGELLSAAGDVPVMVFAGPGMQPVHTGHHLLDGVLRRLEGGADTPTTGLLDHARRTVRGLLPSGLTRRIMRAGDVYGGLSDRANRSCFTVSSNTDNGAIRVNLIGREPHGQIHPGAQFDDFCEQLRLDLLALRNGDTGKSVVRDVIRVDRAFHGPGVALFAPDLLVVWERDSPIEVIESDRVGRLSGQLRGARSGDHSTRSVVLLHGCDMPLGELKCSVSMEDLGATLVALLGLDTSALDGDHLPRSSNASAERPVHSRPS